MGKIYKIVLTGGPCAGKTTAMMRIKTFLESRGIFVITVPEASTLSKNNGVVFLPQAPEIFQLTITSVQKNNEEVFLRFARSIAEYRDSEVVVLYDRALLDGAVYVSEQQFEELLEKCLLPSRAAIINRYDAVFYLVSAAIGAERFYDNTPVRSESLEEARGVENRTIKQWKDHKNLFVFSNENKSFEKKMREVVETLCQILNIPHTMKIPKKFLLENADYVIPSDIEVTVTKVEKIFIINKQLREGENHSDEMSYSFIRSSESNGAHSYAYKTVSMRNKQRIELKEIISFRQFNSYRQFTDPERQAVWQVRELFTIDDVHYEICRYLSPNEGLLLLNVYTTETKQQLRLPPFISVSNEVSRDYRFTSHFLSLIDQTSVYGFKGMNHNKSVMCHEVNNMVKLVNE